MEESSKAYHTYIVKRILLAEVLSFLVGIPIIISEPVGGIYYYALWFGLVAIINITGIIVLFVKKLKDYLKYSAALFLMPLALAGVLFLVVRSMVN